MLEAGLILSRFLHYISVMLVFGASLFPLYCFGNAPAAPAFYRSLKRLLLGSALLALVSLIAWFLFAAATMAGDASAMVDVSVLVTIIESMGFGKLWIARLVLTALVLITLLRWPGRLSSWLAPSLAALLLVSLAGTGHAQEPEVTGWHWHMLADGAHLLAAGAWLGALCPLAFALRMSEQTGALLLRFSAMGQLAVATLLLSGLVNSWFLVRSVGQLVTTTYGQLLSVKIALFSVMLALAAANRFWITPQFAQPLPPSGRLLWMTRLHRHVVVEQALGLMVLAVVSLLGTLQPATISQFDRIQRTDVTPTVFRSSPF